MTDDRRERVGFSEGVAVSYEPPSMLERPASAEAESSTQSAAAVDWRALGRDIIRRFPKTMARLAE